jgi:DNA-binding IclR family transcriptional regulator
MFTELFGGAPHARVFDFLAGQPDVDHTITEITRGCDVARPTVYKVVDDFLEQELIVETRTVGNSRFFQLNQENQTVHDLLRVIEPEIEEPGFARFSVGVPETEGEHPSRSKQKR